jgi:hypothetical protein
MATATNRAVAVVTRVAGEDAMANGSTMVMFFFRVAVDAPPFFSRPCFLVGHVLSWHERYVQNYVFAFCACGWGLVLSTKLLAGKVCFYAFMFFENEPVYTLLALTHRRND